LDGQQRIQSLILAFSGEADGLSLSDAQWMRSYFKKDLRGRKKNRTNTICGPARIYLNLTELVEQRRTRKLDQLIFFNLNGSKDQQALVWLLREKCDTSFNNFPLKTAREWPDEIVLVPLDKIWTMAEKNVTADAMLAELSRLPKQHTDYSTYIEVAQLFLDRLSLIRNQPVSCIEIRALILDVDDSEVYNAAIIDIFTRLNTAGERLTREEIAYSWIKRGWTTQSSNQSADKCFNSLRKDLNARSLVFSPDLLVRAVAAVWAVLERNGKLLRQEDYLGGTTTLQVAKFMCREWDRISKSFIYISDQCKKHGIILGDHLLSSLPLSILVSFRIKALVVTKVSPLKNSTFYSEFDTLIDSHFLRFVFCSQIGGIFQQSSSLEKLAANLENCSSQETTTITSVFKDWVAETAYKCSLNFSSAQTRREVVRYRSFLRAWHHIDEPKRQASHPFLTDPNSGQHGRLEVDHIVSVALFDELLLEWGNPAGVKRDEVINRLGNCMLLTKSHNISKFKGCIFEYLSRHSKQGIDCQQVLTHLQIPEELADPRNALSGFDPAERVQRLVDAIHHRESAIKKSFTDFATTQPLTL
jgi:hypothetical protein